MNLVFDPQHMEDMYSMFAVIQIHRGLLRYMPDSSLRADLSESWTESSDHLRFVFKLRTATFSDGTPITADNVVWTFARMFRMKTSMAADMLYIKGADKYAKTKKVEDLGIKSVAKDRVEFQLERPSALFLKHLATADCAILPLNAAIEKISDSTPGAGPFKIERASSNEVVLVKWRPDPADSASPPFRVKFFPAPLSPYEAAISGATDSLANDRLTPEQVSELKQKGWRRIVGGLARERFIILNPDHVPFKTRRWLAHRVDSERIVADLKLSLVSAFGFVPFTLPGYLEKSAVKAFRSETVDEPISSQFDLEYMEGDPDDQRVAEYLIRQWQHPRLKIGLKSFPVGTFLGRLFAAKSPAILGKKGLDYPDAFSVLGYFRKDNSDSYFHVADTDVDRMLAKASQEFDDEKRVALYREIQLKVLRIYTLVPVAFGSTESGLWSPRLRYTPPHPMGFHTIPLEMVEFLPN